MHEKPYETQTGWSVLPFVLLMYLVAAISFVYGVKAADDGAEGWGAAIILLSALIFFTAVISTFGFFILQPNEARVFLLFGKYVGTRRQDGFGWVNPFFSKRKISLRLRNLNGDRLKVNDLTGNPIEIAMVLVWRVEDTYSAFFEVDQYAEYVKIQGEAALRHLASSYPYDSWDDENKISLRGDIDQVSEALMKELGVRLEKAGVHVHEARLSHLAYAPEIAETMLRRQQASAIIAARTRIVEGAVGMVRLALNQLREEKIIELDDERKAAMVSNLLVVLCSESHTQPIINAGTLYH